MFMSDVTVKVSMPFNDATARIILSSVASEKEKYNKAWAWWCHDAGEEWYGYGDARVRVTQRVFPDTDAYELYGEEDTEIVFEFDVKGSIDPRYFRITGEYSSYGGEKWDDYAFKEVRPTKVVRQVFENVR